MKYIFKFYFKAVILFLFLFVFPAGVFADSDFETSYSSVYYVSENGIVDGRQDITIRNLTDNKYVSQYSMTVGSVDLSNIKVSDNFGSIAPNIEKGNNFTKIGIEFNNNVVGLDKEIDLKVSYQTPDFAIVKGQVLEVNVPSIARKDDLGDYKLSLYVPLKFGKPSFISPQPDSQQQTGDKTVYNFSHNTLLKNDSVFAAFGETQYFDFTFEYHLSNPNKLPARTEISLPPDTAFQIVHYNSISPEPERIYVDDDDNWMAEYIVPPEESLTVIASGWAEIFLEPKNELKTKPLDSLEKQRYLVKQRYWEKDSPEIQKLAESIKNPEDAYNFVVQSLEYDYERLNKSFVRLGALEALKNKESALCTEFSDLLVAILRAAGIPAREINGYAYTSNDKLRPLSLKQDVLHSWVEYYDENKELWVPIDPTWGNTTGGMDFFNKLDLSHFVFVRHGVESEYPYPAGSYSEEEKEKNIFVEFSEKGNADKNIQISNNLPLEDVAGLPIKGKIYIKNVGNTAYHSKKAVLSANGTSKEFDISVLPPYGAFEIPVSFSTKWTDDNPQIISLQFDDKKSSFEVKVVPFYQYLFKNIVNELKNLPASLKGYLTGIPFI